MGGVKKKIQRILVPQILLGFTIMIMRGVPWLINGNSMVDFDFMYCFGYWFLPTLFLVSVLYMTISCFANINNTATKAWMLSITMIVIGLTQFVLDIPNGFFIKYVKIVPVAFLFYLTGRMLKNIVLSSESDGKWRQGVVLLLCAPLLYIITQWNTPVKMYLSEYGVFPLFLLSSIIGIYLVAIGSKHIKNLGILRELGEMSIAVYVWNFLVETTVKSVSFRLLKMTDLYTSGAHAAITFLVSICVIYLICKFTMKKIPFVYGIFK